MSITNFSAQEPSLGYYYQIRYSLYLLIKDKIKSNPILKIEQLDDITIEDIDKTNLFQTKLHINSKANLTNASSDFWKTIRVWSEHIVNELVDINNTIFTLVTTETVSDTSFIDKFKYEDKYSKEILKDMLLTIDKSDSQTNLSAYNSFKKLSENQQLKLIENIYILDASISIDKTLEALTNELKFSAPVNKLTVFVEHLEGWWFQQCIEMLLQKRDFISSNEVIQKISDIRDTFQLDNLPDNFSDPLKIDEGDLPDYEDKIFVRQLKLIAIKNNTLKNAISDFRRAYEQRSKWLRDNLINIDEFEKYDKNLLDHWNTIFSLIKDDCEGMSSEELIKIGSDFYRKYYVERIPPIRIRERFQPEYVTRGSCHMLSDEKKLGWHPDFSSLLK
jgi:hypothetical protein